MIQTARKPEMSKKINVVAISMLFSLSHALAENPAQYEFRAYTITDLGVLPGGVSTGASGINIRGQVTGSATVPAPAPSQPPFKGTPNPYTEHTILYSYGRLQDLGTFGGDSSGGSAINDHGQVIGFSEYPDNSIHAFLLTAGHGSDLGNLGGSLTEALGINNFGLVVGWTSLSNGAQRAYVYDGQIHDLQLGDNTEATGINDFGQIIGDETGPAVGITSAFLLTRGHLELLPSLGGFATWARSVNNRGHVAGFSWIADNSTYHAILYVHGHTKDLGTLTGSTGSSFATSINIRDEIVGTSTPITTGQDSAFLYRRGQMFDLNTLLRGNSGWVLQEATGINDLGQIVGSGIHNGLARAFLMRPIR